MLGIYLEENLTQKGDWTYFTQSSDSQDAISLKRVTSLLPTCKGDQKRVKNSVSDLGSEMSVSGRMLPRYFQRSWPGKTSNNRHEPFPIFLSVAMASILLDTLSLAYTFRTWVRAVLKEMKSVSAISRSLSP